MSCPCSRTSRPPITTVIIPNELLKSIKPADSDVLIRIGEPESVADEPGELFSYPATLTQAGVTAGGKTIAGVYPDYRRVIPAKVSGEPAHFDVKLLALLARAETILHGPSKHLATIGQNGANAAALISLGRDDFIGAISPRRPEKIFVPTDAPAWVHDLHLMPPADAVASADDLV